MIAPYLPHITEEIYQNYFKQFNTEISIHKFTFPEEILNIANSDEIISEFEKISEIIESVRRFKTEKQISM
jgi:valyl-tRNA synthetase